MEKKKNIRDWLIEREKASDLPHAPDKDPIYVITMGDSGLAVVDER